MKIALIEVSLASSNPRLPSTSISALAAAKAFGATTLVAAADPGFYEGQIDHLVDLWVRCDTTSGSSIAVALEHYRPDAVLTFSDLFVTEAAEAAARLRLRHPSNQFSPAIARDKGRVRAALDAAGLPNARWAVIDAREKRPQSPLGYPVVVKPVDGCASWDVRLVRDEDELRQACAVHLGRESYGRGVLPRHLVLCEEVLDGPLVSVEGFSAGEAVEI